MPQLLPQAQQQQRQQQQQHQQRRFRRGARLAACMQQQGWDRTAPGGLACWPKTHATKPQTVGSSRCCKAQAVCPSPQEQPPSKASSDECQRRYSSGEADSLPAAAAAAAAATVSATAAAAAALEQTAWCIGVMHSKASTSHVSSRSEERGTAAAAAAEGGRSIERVRASSRNSIQRDSRIINSSSNNNSSSTSSSNSNYSSSTRSSKPRSNSSALLEAPSGAASFGAE
ncbi:hypothetical protein ACSSS7_002087 [Eimeria intestinalis]